MNQNTRMARPLAEADPAVFEAIRHELERQDSHLELIASENFTSEAVLEATGSIFTNKYAEGIQASAITAAASSPTSSRIWLETVRNSCLAPSLPTFSRTRVRRRMKRLMRLFCSRATRFWA